MWEFKVQACHFFPEQLEATMPILLSLETNTYVQVQRPLGLRKSCLQLTLHLRQTYGSFRKTEPLRAIAQRGGSSLS